MVILETVGLKWFCHWRRSHGLFFLADGEENTEEKRPAVGLVDVCLCFFFFSASGLL